MLPGTYDLIGYRGDTFRRTFTFQDKAGAALVLPTTGWLAHIRAQRNASSTLAMLTVDATAAATGVVAVSLTADQTEALISGYWDLQLTEGSTVRTYVQGSARFDQDVTR